MKLSDWLERGEEYRKEHNWKVVRDDWGKLNKNDETCGVCAIAAAYMASENTLELPTAWTAVSYDSYIVKNVYDGESFPFEVELPIPEDELETDHFSSYESVYALTGWILQRFDTDRWSVKRIVKELRKVGL